MDPLTLALGLLAAATLLDTATEDVRKRYDKKTLIHHLQKLILNAKTFDEAVDIIRAIPDRNLQQIVLELPYEGGYSHARHFIELNEIQNSQDEMDEMDRFFNAPIEEVDEYLRSQGIDPEKCAQEGRDLVTIGLASKKRKIEE